MTDDKRRSSVPPVSPRQHPWKSDCRNTSLPAASAGVAGIRPNRLFTADSAIIVYRAGHVSRTKRGETVDRLIALLQAG